MITISGCTTTYLWVKEGLDPQHAQTKFAACQLEAERLRWSSEEDDEDRAARVLHETQLCMKADGWHRVREDGESVREESFAVAPTSYKTKANGHITEQSTEGSTASGYGEERARSGADADSSSKSRDPSSKNASDKAASEEEEDDDEE